ncbi:MAG: acyl-CoA dehydrogenase [Solirubrobacteraceae bacterium]|jgi:alkylation response protein AidB-like acyl-CoA dehydrogenase|nr:acyl-CoA dehydrogenase [Solirubrobacteraceae bacterium]
MRRTVFTEEHEAFREKVRAFVEAEIEPNYASWERDHKPSREFWRGAGELGMLGIGVPEEYGGLPGSGFKHSAVITEEVTRAGLSVGGVRVQTDICMPYLLHYATDEQKARWLPKLTSGEWVIALAMSEPGAGSDMKAMSTSAVRDGDTYIVNGGKTFISNGTLCDLVILAVKTDPSAGRRGISLLVVEADSPGFERGRSLEKIGQHAQDLAELFFTDMAVPVSNLLGEENQGFQYLSSNLASERLSIAINCQAHATGVLHRTVAFVGEGAEQHAKFELAGCATEIAAGQALIDQALEANERGELTVADAASVKLYCTELQGRVVDRCLQLHGPAGYAKTSPIGRAFADARVSRIYGGSSEIMKVIVAKDIGL